MRATRLALLLFLLVIAPRVAHAECSGADDIDKVLGVAPDGRFVFTSETRTDAAEGSTYELAVLTATGESETRITRGEKGAWKLEGKPLPPSVLAGKPSPRVLETRVQTLLGATAALVPAMRDVRVVKGESAYRVFIDRALVKMMKVGDPADVASERSWRARVLTHPSAPLLFLALSSHTQPRGSCKINVESIDWVAPTKLDPDDKLVAAAFCDEQLEQDEKKHGADDDDETFHLEDPMAQWLACTKEAFTGAYLDKAAARAATLDDKPRLRLLRAVAHTVETTWAPLLRMSKSKQADDRAFAIAAMASLGAELRKNSVHGEKRDPAFRSLLLPELQRLCGTNPKASAGEAAAITACQAEIAQPTVSTQPDEEPCHPGSCARQLVGIGADGQFFVERTTTTKSAIDQKTRSVAAFELRAIDGQLLLRITDNCKTKDCAMRWDLDGAATGVVIELTASDPKPDKLRAELVRELSLTMPRPSSQPVTLANNLLRVGLWTVATVEPDKLSVMTPLEHAKSALLFVDTADETCKDARCHLVVWGPRPIADPQDFEALTKACQKRSDLGALAECLGSILDERVYPVLLHYAHNDDDSRLADAAARVATALGRKALFEYAGAYDVFKRQWALYALEQVLADTTERLPFTARAPDKRRAALVAEIEPICKRALGDRDLIVAGGAIACLAQTTTKIDPKRLREVLHSPHLDTRAAVFRVAKREDALGPELRYVAGWLAEPIDKKEQDYQEFLHGEVCSFFFTKLDAESKKWLRPLVEARLKTLTLRPDAKGACKTLLSLL